MQIGFFTGFLKLIVRRVKLGVEQIVFNCAVEEVGILRDDAYMLPQEGEVERAQIIGIKENAPARDIVKPRYQVNDRRFTRAGRTDDGDGFALRHLEADMVKHNLSLVVAEAHVVKGELAVN